MERHYGMDWLRVGAFALLIFYHVGMVFVPWGFHIKTAQPLDWAEIPMFLTNPWRLSLLFVVSGYASRALVLKSPGVGAFLRSRNARLLIPLAFGVAVVVPPQPWVELVAQHGYTHGYWYFLTHDYFRFGTLSGIILPTYNHLWFVVYLWLYTLGLGALMACGIKAQPLFDRVFAGSRAVWLPILWVVLFQSVIFARNEDSHDIVNDLPAHLRYIPAFLFGFGLAGSKILMAALSDWRRVSAGLAMAGFATIAGLLIAYPDFSFEARWQIWAFRLARDVETWTAIAALIGFAERHLNRDHGWRPMLTEAVFPFYIIHQTVIVVVMYWIKPLGVGPLAEFVTLVAATVAGCWAFYLIGREIPLLRPLIGLRAKPRARGHDMDAHDSRWSRSHRAQPDLA